MTLGRRKWELYTDAGHESHRPNSNPESRNVGKSEVLNAGCHQDRHNRARVCIMKSGMSSSVNSAGEESGEIEPGGYSFLSS